MNDVRDAYDGAGDSWVRRPEQLYRRLAEALLDRSPVPVSGSTVLDVGAGTGVAGRVAAERGAVRVVAADLAAGMLAHADGSRVVADAQVLPFVTGSFDLVVQNFVLGHLPDPRAGVSEARRVGRTLLASSFAADWDHPAKSAIDAVLSAAGFELPDWYVGMKATEDRVSDPDALASLAAAAGFAEVEVSRVEVATGIDDAEAMVEWRWGMAQTAPFLATLDDGERQRIRSACLAAVSGLEPVVVPMLALTAR